MSIFNGSGDALGVARFFVDACTICLNGPRRGIIYVHGKESDDYSDYELRIGKYHVPVVGKGRPFSIRAGRGILTSLYENSLAVIGMGYHGRVEVSYSLKRMTDEGEMLCDGKLRCENFRFQYIVEAPGRTSKNNWSIHDSLSVMGMRIY